MQAVTRVKLEQASKVKMWTPTRLRNDGEARPGSRMALAARRPPVNGAGARRSGPPAFGIFQRKARPGKRHKKHQQQGMLDALEREHADRVRRPPLPSHSYIEKLEYWAVVWGTAVMSLTGTMLWANRWILKWLPKAILDLAGRVHFYEAVLAGLAILVWRFYSVIFDPDVYPMETSWLTGRSVKARRRTRRGRSFKRKPHATYFAYCQSFCMNLNRLFDRLQLSAHRCGIVWDSA